MTSKVYWNKAAEDARRHKKVEWMHICLGKPVPPIYDGSYNFLIWDLLQQRAKRDGVFVDYNPNSFLLAKSTEVPVVQIEVPKVGRFHRNLDLLNLGLHNIFSKHFLNKKQKTFVLEAVDVIKQLNVKKVLIWGAIDLIPRFRKELPSHTIAFAQRHYDFPPSRSYYNLCDYVIMLTKGQIRHAFSRMGSVDPFLTCIPNGVELNKFLPASSEDKEHFRNEIGIPKDKFVILFPNKLAPYKGTAYLRKWIKYASKNLPDFFFLVVGEMHYSMPKHHRQPLIQLFESMANVRWIEGIARESMPPIYKMADVCLLPSLCREGFSMCAIEAMASGLPVVASESGAFLEYIKHGHNGFLCPVDQLFHEGIKALTKLSENQDLAIQMGKNARRYAEEKLSREKCVTNYISFLENDYFSIDSELNF